MKIRLLTDVQGHGWKGLKKDTEHDAIAAASGTALWVVNDADETVRLLSYEYEVVNDDED